MKEFSYIMVYSVLYFRYGLDEFNLSRIHGELKGLKFKTPLNIIIQRLCEKKYIERVGRGRYRVIPPNILLLESLGYRWRDKIDVDYRPIIEFVVSKIIDHFRERLISIVLFGSLARGNVKNTSDIDLLIIADEISPNYSERIRMVSTILDDVSEFRCKLWEGKGIYPLLDMIILNREEASVNHPFYLDIVHDSIIVYDKDSFMEMRIRSIRERLSELGSRRIELPNGHYYWVLKPQLKWGEIIEL